MQIKPRNSWKLNCSIVRGRTPGGQIRWKGTSADGVTDRFLLIVERNRGSDDYARITRMVEGTPEDASVELRKLVAEAESASSSTNCSDGEERGTEIISEKEYLEHQERQRGSLLLGVAIFAGVLIYRRLKN